MLSLYYSVSIVYCTDVLQICKKNVNDEIYQPTQSRVFIPGLVRIKSQLQGALTGHAKSLNWTVQLQEAFSLNSSGVQEVCHLIGFVQF